MPKMPTETMVALRAAAAHALTPERSWTADEVAEMPQRMVRIEDLLQQAYDLGHEAPIEVKRRICHDCDAEEGQYHMPGCDMECCPFCEEQLISCHCSYRHLGINVVPGTRGFNKRVYSEGFNGDESAEWERTLKAKGLIPYVAPMNLCARCGEQWPKMFHADDWEKFVVPALRNKMLCLGCFNHMKEIMPNGWRKVEEV